MKSSRSLLILTAAVILGANNVHAQVFVTTLTKPSDGNIGVVGNQQVGMSFATDGMSYDLNSISVPINENTAATLTGELFLADGSDLPTGTALVSFSHGAIAGTVSFAPTVSITLDPGTSYVFALRSPSGDYSWDSTLSNTGFDQPSGGAWSMAAVLPASVDGGASWFDASGGGERAMGAVNATAVPEPGAYVLATAVGLIAFAVWRRKQPRPQAVAGKLIS